MGRYAEQYTEQQRTAVGSAMLDPDPLTQKPLTAREATRRLNEGKLGVPPPASPMPVTSAYDYKRREARRRAGHELSPLARQALEDPATTGTQLRQRVLTLHEHQLAELEQQRAQGKPIDPRQYSNVVKNTPIVLAMFKPPSKNGDAQKRANSKPTEPTKPDVVRDLLKASKAQGQTTTTTGPAADSGAGTQVGSYTNTPPTLASS